MKLKEFNTGNVTVSRSKTPSFSVNTKVGLFNFNKSACELLGLKNEDQIVLLQDEEDTENWYLEKVNKQGFVVRQKDSITTGVLFNNSSLARMLVEGMELNGGGVSYKFLIAGKPTEFQKRKLFGIIKATVAQ